MFDFINRFIEDSRPEIAATFDDLFGPDWFQDWKEYHSNGLSREAAVIEVYSNRLRQSGNFAYVTSTRIIKSQADRSYFYLIYATEHWQGIQEFRAVEKKMINVQEKIRDAAKYKATVSRTGQESLFGRQYIDLANKSYEEERETQLERGYTKFTATLDTSLEGIKYENLLGITLETPLVWESDLKEWIADSVKSGVIKILGMAGGQRVPKKGNIIKRI